LKSTTPFQRQVSIIRTNPWIKYASVIAIKSSRQINILDLSAPTNTHPAHNLLRNPLPAISNENKFIVRRADSSMTDLNVQRQPCGCYSASERYHICLERFSLGDIWSARRIRAPPTYYFVNTQLRDDIYADSTRVTNFISLPRVFSAQVHDGRYLYDTHITPHDRQISNSSCCD